jgi:hypothetical protein
VVAETESEQSFIDDEIAPDVYTAMLPGSAEKPSTSALETSGPALAIHTRYRQSRRFQLQRYRRAIPAGHKCKLFPIPIAPHPQVCVYTVAEKAAEMIAQSAVEVCVACELWHEIKKLFLGARKKRGGSLGC